MTRVTNAIRKVCFDIQAKACPQTLKDLVAKAVTLCKAVVPSQDKVEELLLADRASARKHTLDTARENASGPYKNLVSFYNEVVAIHNHHAAKGKIKTEDNKSVKKLKALKD